MLIIIFLILIIYGSMTYQSISLGFSLGEMVRKSHNRKKTIIRKEFGRRVRRYRHNLEWTQETLAEKANLHPTYVGSVERGERNIALENIIAIANALKISPKELFPE